MKTLTFVPPNQNSIWKAFQQYYAQTPITLEENLIANLSKPEKNFNSINIIQAEQILQNQAKLKTIDMGPFGQGVITTEVIEQGQCILPITGDYHLAGQPVPNDDKIIKLKMYEDFFLQGQQVMLHQQGLFSLIQHASNVEEMTNYFDLSMEAAEAQRIVTENLIFDQAVIADFMVNDQQVSLPFPLVRAARKLQSNHMLAYCYGDRFWQKRTYQNPEHYFRCFHLDTHQVVHQLPMRRAFWFEIEGRPIKPLLIDNADIGKDILLTINNKNYTCSGMQIRRLVEQYPYSTMLRIEL